MDEQEALCMCVRDTVADSHLTTIHFQLSSAQCENLFIYNFSGMRLESMGIKQSAQSSKTELNILFRKYQRPDNDSAISQKRPESRQPMLQEREYYHSVLPISPASELNSYILPLPYPATMVAFLSTVLAILSKNLKLKALSIMSFPVSSHTTMESKSLGKDTGGYTNNSKGKKNVDKQAPDVSEKQNR